MSASLRSHFALLVIFVAFAGSQAYAQAVKEYSPASQQSQVSKDWFNFEPFPELWRYIRTNSKQYEMTRRIEHNRIKSLSIFCTKEVSPDVQGFWIETNLNQRECYIFAESKPERMSYGEFLIKMGLADAEKKGDIETISVQQFESELKLVPTSQDIHVVVTEAEAQKAINRMKNLTQIREFVTLNNDPNQRSKSDLEIDQEKFNRLFKDYVKPTPSK